MKYKIIDIDDIILTRNIRDDEPVGLRELAKNIERYGLLHPITVKKRGDKYELIAGRRRYHALMIAGEKRIPVNVVDIDRTENNLYRLIENIQRENLRPLEIFNMIEELRARGLTIAGVAEKINKSKAWVENKIKYASVYQELVGAGVDAGDMPEGHLVKMIGLTTGEKIELVNWYREGIKSGKKISQRDIIRKRKEVKGQRYKPDYNKIGAGFAITKTGKRSLLLTFKDERTMYRIFRKLKEMGGKLYYSESA